LHTTQLFIDNAWVDASSDDHLDVTNPSTGQTHAHMAMGTVADVDRAVRCARHALDNGPWATMSGYARRKLLLAFAREIQADSQVIGELKSDDMGMPLLFAPLAVQVAADNLEYFAGWADKVGGEVIPTRVHGELDYTIRHPVGVVAAIVPWNAPTFLTIQKIAPALVAGCTVVLKPSEQAPLAPLHLARCAERAGLPPGVLNIVTGLGTEVGTALIDHPGVDKISYTGSTEVGRVIGQRAAAQLKRCSLELGGKSANIICNDADLDAAVIGATTGVLMNSGQQCIAGSRLLIQRDVYVEVLDGVAAMAGQFNVGLARQPTSQMGPLISEDHLKRVLSFIEQAADVGEVRLGGERLGGDLADGWFVGPTLVADVDPASELWREEVFGPVLAARPFDTIDEAISLANDSRYGLAGGVWTSDLDTAHHVARSVRTGQMWVNTYLAVVPGAPFGGFKDSGVGREGGWAAIEDMTEITNVHVALKPKA